MDISTSISETGITRIAKACGVAPSAVHRWKKRNRLPRTDYTGETRYAETIARLHGGVTANELLERLHVNSRLFEGKAP